LQTLCGLFGYTRQAYYKQLKSNNKEVIREDMIMMKVGHIREQMPRAGGRKLYYMLNESGVSISRDRMFELLRQNGMLVKKRRNYAVTTFSKHWMRKYPNLIRGFNFDMPNLLWVSDITYIPLGKGHAYLSLITDAYSRKILGHYLSRNLTAEGPLEALGMALTNASGTLTGLIHHSDRGIQYCCKEYVDMLKRHQIRISMTENGDPYENALAERVNGILKTEWINLEHFDNYQQAKVRIDEIIDLYNNLRPHMSCDMMTPAKAYQMSGELKKHWRKKTAKQTSV